MRNKPVLIVFFVIILLVLILSITIFNRSKSSNLCGDGICSEDENCRTCPQDCGECIEQSAGYIYLESNDGLKIYDVAESGIPKLIRKIDIGISNLHLRDIHEEEDKVYLLDDSNLIVLDTSDKSRPEILGELRLLKKGYGLDVQGNFAYITNQEEGLQIINISNPKSMKVVYLGIGYDLGLSDEEDSLSREEFVEEIEEDVEPLDYMNFENNRIDQEVNVKNNDYYLDQNNVKLDIGVVLKSYSGEFISVSYELFKIVKNFILKYLILIGAFILLFGLILVIVYGKWISQKVEENIISSKMASLNKDIKNLMYLKVKEFMTKKVVTIDKYDSVIEAAKIFATKDVGCIVVIGNKIPVGILTERDLLRKMDFQNFAKAKVRDICSSSLQSVSPDTTFLSAMNTLLECNIRKMPVTFNNKLVGIITQTDLLRKFDKFFKKNEFEASNVPLVRNITKRTDICTVKKDEKLIEVLNFMVKKNADAAIVTRYETLEVSGILTERDILCELYKTPNLIKKMKVGQIMNRNVFNVTPGTSVFDANKMMIEKNVRRLAVVSNNNLKGVATQTNILRSISSFLIELNHSNAKGINPFVVPVVDG